MKIEINYREYIDILGQKQVPFSVESDWFAGQCQIRTYSLEELLGSKVRALYQRKKGRDLFDLWLSITNADISCEKILHCFHVFINHVDCHVSKSEFMANMTQKMKDSGFRSDTTALIRPELEFDIDVAWEVVRSELIERI
ncbi:MAG: nucleotidyl transferase AbiEii/AbiGii toxin family protein [Chitinispirillia bacterium]